MSVVKNENTQLKLEFLKSINKIEDSRLRLEFINNLLATDTSNSPLLLQAKDHVKAEVTQQEPQVHSVPTSMFTSKGCSANAAQAPKVGFSR